MTHKVTEERQQQEKKYIVEERNGGWEYKIRDRKQFGKWTEGVNAHCHLDNGINLINKWANNVICVLLINCVNYNDEPLYKIDKMHDMRHITISFLYNTNNIDYYVSIRK